MESKKAFCPNTPDAVIVDPALKHSHQHNSGPLHLTLVQYGPKVPNQHVHTALQLPTRSHQHPGITPNVHPHNHHQYRTHQWPCEQVPTLPHEQYYQPSIGTSAPQALNRNEIYNYGVQQHQKYKALQTPSPSPISPQVKDLEKKVKPNTGSQQLKSPSAKRPVKAPVTLQGWLHKQGSEGLMLWKKRWFVLSEYCLYYYKSPQEEKLLGSILLPSYNVSVCQPEGRVNKKHSFKCEHANMRTYVLAADSQELMKQWVHVLTMASLLQTTVDIQRPIQFNFENTPVHQHSVSNTTELSNQSQSSQPLYANAPPKPRRLTDEYTSPSPEMMDTYSNGPRYVTLDPSYCKEQVRLQKKLPKSPTDIYGNLRFFPEAQRHHHHPQQLPLAKNNLHALPDHAYIHGFQNAERRTPDTYGPSKLNNPRSRQPSDYEDIYGENFMYKRPLSPLQYTRPAQVQRPVIYRAPQIPINNCQPPPSQKMSEVIPRPHSADFLEYQMKHDGPAMVAKCQPRPKSSLDINKHAPNDTYFYSEQHYAEKMRKSVQYLPHMLPNVEYVECIRRKTENPLHFRSLARENHNFGREVQPVRSRSVLSDGSLCRSPEVDFDDSLFKDTKLAFYNRSDNIHGFEEDLNKMSPMEYNQFCRSASARFINKQLNDKATSREGDRKREESMKRLLEWKQRMLQSPLNRKAQNFQAKKFNIPNRYASPEFRQDARPLQSSNSQYNSYSSDDEEIHDGSNECTEMQAGRTSDAFPCTSQSHSPALITPTNVTIPEVEPERTSATKELVDAVLEKPLKLSNTYPTPTALVSSLRSEFHNEFKDSLPVTQVPSTGALVKNILYGFENGGDNALSSSSAFESGGADENYMTMTSRSSILSSVSGNFETKDPLSLKNIETDENPYVEMTQNAANSMLMPNVNKNEAQTYEIVCFSDAKMEPVYVELNQSSTVDTMLPDVLLSLQQKGTPKSDNSDADDEVSKELDSLDTSSGRTRFSLSDTFRPASYYLGVSATNAEPQDSSDSELVSPPPIPTSSPPLDDAENISNTLALYSVFSESNNTTADTSSAFYSSSMFALSSTADTAKEVDNTEYSDDCLHNENGSDCKVGTVYQNIILKQSMLSEECQCNVSGECSGLKDPFQTNMKVLVFPNYENLCMYNLEESKILSLNECASAVTSQLSIEEINSALGVSNGLNHHPAPYYYSDLSINTSDTNSVSSVLTLNNQRCSVIGNKRDIAHIVNPIKRSSHILNATHPPHHMPSGNPLRLAAEARSASADFLNIADKSGSIDEKNIYESDTLKRIKSIPQPVTDALNFYPSSKTDKFNGRLGPCSEANMRRSYSLEGLLESPLLHNVVIAHLNSVPRQKDNEVVEAAVVTEGSHLWEEDAIWREQLRLASQRHTKSLEHLESTGDEVLQPKKQVRAITRAVTYVNDNMFCQKPLAKVLSDRDSDTLQAACQGGSSFTIDREKLRQWDFLSSAPSDNQTSAMALPPDKVAGAGAASDTSVINKSASGSVSINASTIPVPSNSIKRNSRKTDGEKDLELQHLRTHTLQYGTGEYERPVREKWQVEDKMNMSAGELLSRTHEELVLLLIQLRRKSANTCNAIDGCYNEIDKLQSQLLPKMDAAKRLESLHKLEEIKQHLLELEKQYEKGKPLVNLVDNMVKLGSLYKFPKETIENTVVKNRLEFNQQVQERRLLAEERRDWNRLSPNHDELQAKVNQLYHLDRLIQEESGTLHALQHDKEEIERVLGGLRNRFSEGFDDPAEVEHARRQQFVLENELSRIHTLLARNSRKLEETVVGNARLEQELLVLKQKLQTSRQQRFSPQISNAGDSLPCMVGNSTVLESDLYKVQQNVGDLERQRLELSMQVRQLTDRSSIVQPIRSSSNIRIPQVNKKKITALWRETDLDTMKSIDHGHFQNCHSDDHSPITPLYVNMDVTDPELSPVGGDTTTIYNLPHERQEIKTVRIVKRESERRQRDREKMTSEKWDPLAEEDSNLSQGQRGLPDHLGANNDDGATTSGCYIKPEADSSAETNLDKSAQLSPVFKSKAARQIMIEMSSSDAAKEVTPSNRRLVPKERRRHHTAPHNNLIMKSLSQLPIYDKELETFEPNSRRARDDMDMERALRQRINAPDIVRSTLGNKELKYNENTIDTILGTPNKIYIPERYIPEQLPQLSVEEQQHRMRKVESIKKMLSDSAVISSSTANLAASDDTTTEDAPSSGSTNKLTTRMIEEKKQREHLLQLNQILAKQVIEMSKIVAEKALVQRTRHPPSSDEELSSPEIPLPIYQQRDNFYS